jgi:hypothetical protein
MSGNMEFDTTTPPVTVLEALIALGKAKRLAIVNTVSMIADDSDDEDESLFGEDEEETA